MAETELSKKMRALAETQSPEIAAPLCDLADKLDAATDAAYAPGAAIADGSLTKRMIGCWARARRAYCEVTGEPLLRGM